MRYSRNNSGTRIDPVNKPVSSVLFFLIFVAFGVITLLFAYLLNNHDGWEKIAATISTVDHSNAQTFVSYIYGGSEYTNILLNEYSSFHQVGQSIDIFVNPSNASSIQSASFASQVIIFVIAYVVLGIGIIGIIYVIIKRITVKTSNERIQTMNANTGFTPGYLKWESDPNIGSDIPNFDDNNCSLYIFTSNGAKKTLFEMSDKDNGLVFINAKKTGYKPFKGKVYTFSNSLSGKSEKHIMAECFSQLEQYKNPNHFTSIYFLLDYIRVWDYLDHKGLAINYGSNGGFIVTLFHKQIGTICKDENGKANTFMIKCNKLYADHLFLCSVVIAFGMFDCLAN